MSVKFVGRLVEAVNELSDTSLDAVIPSLPGSPRSVAYGSYRESFSDDDINKSRLVHFLHDDKEFLIAAELGNARLLEVFIRKGCDIQQKDHLGRNALHLAVCADSMRAIKLLLDARVHPNIKDNVGMTPLSLSLMRRPSSAVAKMLFDYGATLMPRTCETDTGLFLQFVIMCKPTQEEAKILRLLLTKGAVLEDPGAPGGRQALHFAAMSNNCELINVLTDLGADLFVKNHRDQTPKDVAVAFNCKEAQLCLEDKEYMNVFAVRNSDIPKPLSIKLD